MEMVRENPRRTKEGKMSSKMRTELSAAVAAVGMIAFTTLAAIVSDAAGTEWYNQILAVLAVSPMLFVVMAATFAIIPEAE
jgi:hypothetical protein